MIYESNSDACSTIVAAVHNSPKFNSLISNEKYEFVQHFADLGKLWHNSPFIEMVVTKPASLWNRLNGINKKVCMNSDHDVIFNCFVHYLARKSDGIPRSIDMGAPATRLAELIRHSPERFTFDEECNHNSQCISISLDESVLFSYMRFPHQGIYAFDMFNEKLFNALESHFLCIWMYAMLENKYKVKEDKQREDQLEHLRKSIGINL